MDDFRINLDNIGANIHEIHVAFKEEAGAGDDAVTHKVIGIS